jgi:hypothetical protein
MQFFFIVAVRPGTTSRKEFYEAMFARSTALRQIAPARPRARDATSACVAAQHHVSGMERQEVCLAAPP